jgi:hypothetical protein
MISLLCLLRLASIFGILLGLVMKVLHWPGGELMMRSGAIMLIITLVARFILRKNGQEA